jgi:hypothetical protein
MPGGRRKPGVKGRPKVGAQPRVTCTKKSEPAGWRVTQAPHESATRHPAGVCGRLPGVALTAFAPACGRLPSVATFALRASVALTSVATFALRAAVALPSVATFALRAPVRSLRAPPRAVICCPASAGLNDRQPGNQGMTEYSASRHLNLWTKAHDRGRGRGREREQPRQRREQPRQRREQTRQRQGQPQGLPLRMARWRA